MISNARILLDVFLGFGVGYTAAGTFNHFFITPKPVSMMIGLLENKFVVSKERDEVFRVKWNGVVNKNQANVSCPLVLNENIPAVVVGRFIKDKRKKWRPLYVSVSVKNKDVVLFNIFS